MKYIAGAIVGALLAVFACNYTYFEFEKKIQWGDLFAAGITSVVGIYIADKISSHQTSSRSEKDFIMGELKEFKLSLNKIKLINDVGSIGFEEAKTTFRDVNHDLTHLEELCQFSEFSKKAKFDDLRAEFSFVRKQILNISPIQDIINIPGNVRTSVDLSIDKMKKHIYIIILTINK